MSWNDLVRDDAWSFSANSLDSSSECASTNFVNFEPIIFLTPY
jgi:hypothetical protein